MSWDTLFPETIVPEGEPGETTGGVGHHEEAYRRLNAARKVVIIGPEGTEAEIAGALADACAAGYGIVRLAGAAYTIAGLSDPALDISVPGVYFDMGGATLSYVGDGVCLRARMDPFTITNAGCVRDGTILGKRYDIDGTTVLESAGAGAIGIQTGSVIGFGWDGVTVKDFDGVGSINWDLYNEAPNTWTERCVFRRCDSRNGTFDWNGRAHEDSPSFLYNDFGDCRFESSGTGQTAIKVTEPAQWFDCQFGFRGNVNEGATVFDLGPQTILRPQMTFSVEQTNPSAGPVFDAKLFADGSSKIVYPRGTFAINNFPDYDAGRQFADYEDRGVTVTFDPFVVDTIEAPTQGFGLSIGEDHLGTWTAVYDGGVGAGFSLLKVGFGETLAESRVAARLDAVTWAEVGFAPGVFSSGARPAADNVPIGTMIYVFDAGPGFVGIPVWSDGTVWRNAAGVIA